MEEYQLFLFGRKDQKGNIKKRADLKEEKKGKYEGKIEVNRVK
jgi:hypothetical protein